MTRRRMVGVQALVCAIAASVASGVDNPVSFNRDIRPIFSDTCFKCHGPDPAVRRADLRMDVRDDALAKHKHGIPIVPGKPDQSEAYRRMVTANADERMPPLNSGKTLAPEQIKLIERWIAQGAEYQPHWAYVKPVRPAVPAGQNAIDYFIRAGLQREGLTPAPEADRYALVRRVALDLTGLPPTIEEVDQFVTDTSTDAYERLVDRLLAKPGYGEHWARLWLDLARYADSAGYADDPPRTIWAYRDYVIRSFNENKPFDQFTVEQLAGDLLPNPTADQLVATAFHRNTMTNSEGGTNDEEFRNAAVVDRVNTTMAVWMGTSMACAQCHSHKFDPLTHKEYFQLFAIFNNTADTDKKEETPVLEVSAADPKAKPMTVPVMRELEGKQRRKTHVQLRGNYLALAEEVSPAVPAVFNPLPADVQPTRLTLARWLVDEHNPLTARVLANRLWEQIFGTGLVRTSEEFGSQGDWPSHPELLDWLATELVQEKWDVKKFLKLLVTSATYRQSSRVTPELLETDPDNRLLARGPRFRLSAEMIRDQALAVSGLLSPKMYGSPARPARPVSGLSAAFGGGLDWKTSEGEDRYRRALYTEWRRTSPYPSLATFDAPTREVCTIRRNRTNTPLQALVTLNDPVYIECAQALAGRMIAGGTTPTDKARLGFRLCLARPPHDGELQRLVALYDEAHAALSKNTTQAVALGAQPAGNAAELAAWTTVANVLLNLDETVMKP